MAWEQLSDDLTFLLIFLGGTAIFLRFFLRPRKPKVIHAHFNRMLSRLFWLLMIPVTVVLVLGTIAPPEYAIYIAIALSVFVVLGTFYSLYWSHSFSRKRTGVKAVDEAVERYKKPGEKVEGAWAPPMELEGGRYWNAYYVDPRSDEREWIVLDGQGGVLTDEGKAEVLRAMLRVVYLVAYPDEINRRTNTYMSSQKGIEGMKVLLNEYPYYAAMDGQSGGRYTKEMQAVKRAARVILRFHESVCSYWLYEAEWGKKHGGTNLKKFSYADWRQLMDVLHEKLLWLRDEIETLEEGAGAAEKVQRHLEENPEVLKRVPNFRYMLEAVIDQRDELKVGFDTLREGVVPGYELGMDEGELKGWRSRLEWVRQVDEWRAAEYEGEALEEMKKKAMAVAVTQTEGQKE